MNFTLCPICNYEMLAIAGGKSYTYVCPKSKPCYEKTVSSEDLNDIYSEYMFFIINDVYYYVRRHHDAHDTFFLFIGDQKREIKITHTNKQNITEISEEDVCKYLKYHNF